MELWFLELTLVMFIAESFLPIADGGLLDAFNILGNGVSTGGQLLTSNPIGGLTDGNTHLGVLGGVGGVTNGAVSPQLQGYQQLNQRYPTQQQLYQNQRYPTQTMINQRPQPNAQNLQSTVGSAQKLLERLQELNKIKEQQRNQTVNGQINQGNYSPNLNGGTTTADNTNYPQNNQLLNQNNEANYPDQNTGNQGLNLNNQLNNNNQNWQRPNNQGDNGGVFHNLEQPEQVKSMPKKMRMKKFFYQARPVIPENEVNMTTFTLFYYD